VNFQPQNQPVDLAHEAAFTVGALEVRPATREVVAGTTPEVLEPRVMQVLVALARRRGEVVSRDELILSCWGGRAVGDDAINRCIARIRRLSETHGGFSLETIARVGYRLNETAPSEGPPPQPVKRRLMPYWGALAAVLVLAAGLALSFWRAPEPPPVKMAAMRPMAKLTIAVLPFTPLYADPEAQHLGDSIASRLADTLTNTAFDIISPAKSLQYRGAAKAQAAQGLHADFLIDGDLRREGDQLSVAMRIIDGHRNTTIVAGTFERPIAQADSVPDQIAAYMASLSPLTHGLNSSASWDPRIVAAYLRANYLDGVRHDPYGAYETTRDLAQTVPDNPFAQIMYGFMAAELATMAAEIGPGLPPERKLGLISEAREAANRAIRLDPSYGDPYAVLALTTPPFDWAAREDYLRRGLTATPESQIGQIQMIELLQHAGRFRESGVMAEKLFASASSQIRPLIEVINARLWQGKPGVRTLITKGEIGIKYAGMGMQYSKIPWFAAKLFEDAAFHGAAGDAQALLRDSAIRNLLEQEGVPVYSHIAVALHYHRRADSDVVAQDCANPSGRGAEMLRTCFMALVALERLDDAFRMAAIVYPDQRGATPEERQQRWFQSPTMPAAYLFIPQTAPLRADPRFRDVVERIGLLQYWRTSHHAPDFCASEKVPVCNLLNS
jgi:DNA-binding winged helix-turn-helix (wHTH) protein/TolB-like protein